MVNKITILILFLAIVLIIVLVFQLFSSLGATSELIPETSDLPFAQEGKFYKIGILQTAASLDSAYEGCKDKMEELGYNEGKNAFYEYFDTKGSKTEGKKKTEEFLIKGFDLIYVIGIAPARAAKEATQGKRIPIVFSAVSNPVETGIVKTLQSPGDNITGITPANEEATAKRVEILKEIKPDLKRIIFPYNDPLTNGLENVKKAAQDLKIELVLKYAADFEELDSFLDSFDFQKDDALLGADDSVLAGRVEKLIEIQKEKKIPLAGTNSADVKSGALISYGADYFLLGQQAAVISAKILKGADPASFPVEFPEKFELSVNKKTAEIISFKFLPEFLAKADLIFEE